MRFCGPAIAVVATAAFAACPSPASAQYQAPSEKLLMTARSAVHLVAGPTDVVLLEGPVTIELDRATLSAKQAVVWITPEDGGGSARQAAGPGGADRRRESPPARGRASPAAATGCW